jgi:hypothetical protein
MTDYVEPQIAADIETQNRTSLVSRMQTVAARLRDLAADVERYAERIENVPTAPVRSNVYVPYAEIVESAQSKVLWGVANLSLDGLTSDAAMADRFRLQRLLGSPEAGDHTTAVVAALRQAAKDARHDGDDCANPYAEEA